MILGVFNADTLEKKQRWQASGGTHVVVQAVWDRLQPAGLDFTTLTAGQGASLARLTQLI